jgi:hypothetical protein
MKRVAGGAFGLFLIAGPLIAQNAPRTEYPPLITSVNVGQSDSYLVRAAKLTVGARHGTKTALMIDEQYLARVLGGVLSTPSDPYFAAPPAPKSDARQVNTLNVAKPATDPAETQKKIVSLKVERERMAAEGLEPYGGDVEEDNVTRRMTQSSTQLEQMQGQPASPPPQP